MALIIRTPSHRFWRYNRTSQAWFTLPQQAHARTSTRSGGGVWNPAVSHRLPRSVDWENAKATFEDGVLDVSMDIVDHGPMQIDIRPWRQ